MEWIDFIIVGIIIWGISVIVDVIKILSDIPDKPFDHE
jgi:hypothetical protein